MYIVCEVCVCIHIYISHMSMPMGRLEVDIRCPVCVSPCHYVHVSADTSRGQKKVLDLMELGLQALMGYLTGVLVTKLSSAVRTGSSLDQ